MGGLAWSAIDARKVAAFVPALGALAGGQALFVACTAAFAAQAGGDPRRLLALAFAGVILKVAGQTGASAIQARWVTRVGERVRAGVLADKSLHRPGSESHTRPRLRQQIPAEVTAHVDDVERAVGEGLLPTVRAWAELAPLAALLVWTVPRFALGAVALLLPFWLWVARGKAARVALGEARRTADHALHAAFDDAVRHDELWRVHGASDRIRGLVHAAGRARGHVAARLAVRTELASGQNEILGVAFVWLCVGLAPDLGTAPTLLLRFFAAFFLTYKPLRQLVQARTALARGRVALAQLDLTEVAALPPRVWAPGELAVIDLRLAHGTQQPITFRAGPGALVLVTGPTGTGKTTLLRALLGLEPGAVTYADEALEGVGPGARPFAWMPQHCPLVGASVQDSLLLQREARALHLLEGVSGDAHTLSGGEAQRVAFVRAVSSPLPVVLLDEPTAHLDAATADRLLEAIETERRAGRTFVVVTHEPERFAHLPDILGVHLQTARDYVRAAA